MAQGGNTTTRRAWLRYSTLGAAAAALGIAGFRTPTASAQSDSRYGIVGREAPELEVGYWIDEHGKSASFSMAKAREKWVYLKCFQNWCPGCHAHGFPALKKVADAFYAGAAATLPATNHHGP